MENALIIVDVQNDYFKGGKFELVNTYEAALNVKELIEVFRKRNEAVIYVQHVSTGENATFFVSGTSGVEISDMIKPLSTDVIVEKHYPNSFLETSLQEELQKLGIKNLVVCGMMTHMCIDTTVRAARGLGYNVTLIDDACTTRDLEWNGEVIKADIVHKTFMASLNGGFAEVIKTDEFISRS